MCKCIYHMYMACMQMHYVEILFNLIYSFMHVLIVRYVYGFMYA